MLTPEQALAAYHQHGSQRAAGEALGVHPQTLWRYARMADRTLKSPGPGGRLKHDRAGTPVTGPIDQPTPHNLTPPVRWAPPPSPDAPIADVIANLVADYERQSAHRRALTWMPIEIPVDGPVALLYFGDPHMGAHGWNAPLFLRHCEICRTVPYVYGAAAGDMTNNWVGSLARLYAHQETSARTEHRLIKWFLRDAGVKFAFATAGNHDEWNNGNVITDALTDGHTFINDWEAKLRLTFPDGNEIRVHAAHDFPGHSMYNPGHGLVRAAMMTSDADVYFAGHKHSPAIQMVERPNGSIAWAIRARGYKEMDRYAITKGFTQWESCAGVFVIIRPDAPPAGRILPFADVEAGVEVFKAMRGTYEAGRRTTVAVCKKPGTPSGAKQKAPKGKPAARAGRRAGGSDGRGQVDGRKGAAKKPRFPRAAVRGAAESNAGRAGRAGTASVGKPRGKSRAARSAGR